MNKIQHKELAPQIFNLKGWIEIVDETILKDAFSDILSQAGFQTLNYSSHQFPVNGFTAFWLLAESHLALHTFTESGWCYIELSSCNKQKTLQFKELCKQFNANIRWNNEIENCIPPSH